MIEVVSPIYGKCKPSRTRVSGSYMKKRKICSGKLLLSENFKTLRQNLWNHELTVNGNGVSTILKLMKDYIRICLEISI